MTELLQRAIAAIEKLPEDIQDAIATRLLAEVADEQAWAASFDATTDAQWDELAAIARHAIHWFWIGSHADYDGLLRRL